MLGHLKELSSRTANAWEVKRFNDDFSEARARLGTDPDTDELEATWVATLISASGYKKLGVNLDELPAGPGKDAFTAGMADRSDLIGDTHPKDVPTQWLDEFRPDAGVHTLIVVAADDPDDLEAKCTQLHGKHWLTVRAIVGS